MGRGSPIPPMLRRKIVEKYQKGFSQRKIAKSLKLSSSTVHNTIQRFRESGTISVRKGQGRKTILDARDLRALRRHCITYSNATVMEITTWAQEYFQKTFSVNTIHRAIRRCRLKLYRSKKKPYLNMIQKRRRFLWAKAHLKWTVAKWKTVLWSDESKFEVLFGKLGRHVNRTKEDKDNPSCYQRSVQKPASLMSQTVVVGGLWNCQSTVRKADFISALASHYSFDFLALTETWISPQNTATLAALSSAYTFSHSPRESGRGGGTVSVTSPMNLFIIVIYRPPGPLGNLLDEMDTLLSVFPSDSTPLVVLGDFNLPSDKLHSSGLLALLNSFSLSFNSCPPTHKEGNVLDLVFTHPSPATDMTVTPLHISDHHLVSFTITLPVLPKRNSQHLSLTRRNLHSISPSSVASCTLSSLPDHESFSSLPLDSATDTLLSSLSSTMDLLCPLSTIRKKSSSTAPWLSDVLCNNRREL
ncbi:hypothetical protein QTP70_009123 [Hemibagrus guttatus]|uniref:Endonuclease/exonuclease/phosphatase domain-containing protein n=1 Tax=Hemibagrus guttatus TaxID=175788 RepID=A0AAE0ULC9_9TELE|nr:hypothetical protein QTP70_009123 [Hemibagrus guttatus]KAK3529964.1 hypothetical protein QTP86_009351 [Hemibagrus guttatus]